MDYNSVLLSKSVYSWMHVSNVFVFLSFFFFSENESSEYASDVSRKVLKRRQKGVSRQRRREGNGAP